MIKNLKYKKTLEFAIIEGNKPLDNKFYTNAGIFFDSIKFDKNLVIVSSAQKSPFGLWIEKSEDKINEIYNSARFVLILNNDRLVIDNTTKTGGIPLFFYSGQRGLAKVKWAGGKNLRDLILKLKKICEKYWYYNRKIRKISLKK
jgi:hypothetical protein